VSLKGISGYLPDDIISVLERCPSNREHSGGMIQTP
jgi:hypothetical protein